MPHGGTVESSKKSTRLEGRMPLKQLLARTLLNPTPSFGFLQRTLTTLTTLHSETKFAMQPQVRKAHCKLWQLNECHWCPRRCPSPERQHDEVVESSRVAAKCWKQLRCSPAEINCKITRMRPALQQMYFGGAQPSQSDPPLCCKAPAARGP